MKHIRKISLLLVWPMSWILVLAFGVIAENAAWGQTLAGQVEVLNAQQQVAGNRGNDRAQDEAAEEPADGAATEGEATEDTAEAAQPASEPLYLELAEDTELPTASLMKLFGLVLVFIMWVRACDWVSQDSQIYRLGWYKWNHLMFAPFAIVAIATFFFPMTSVVRSSVLFVLFLATWIPYVVSHNKNVQPHQTVLTGPWWRHVFATILGTVGIKISSDRVADYEKGAKVDLSAMGGEDATMNNANLLSARNSPGYLLVKEIVADMISRRCERTMFDFTKQGVSVRHEIDGMWHNGEARERESSDVMLAVMKTLANLDVKDRRNKQAGKFGAKYEGKNYVCSLVSQGVATGERVILARDMEKQNFKSYAELGMREGLQEKWEQLMASDSGFLIVSTMPGDGLTTITDVSLEETDRLMRDFAAIEDVNHREREIQNINVTTYDSAAGESPATILPQLIRTYPNVYVCRDLVNVESAHLLFAEVKDEDLVITTVRAREAAEALLRILQMKVSAKDFASIAKAVLYQRLIRLLCPDCKVAYTPPPDVLRKLGIPTGKVEQLYRPPKPEEVNKPCQSCQGMGYRGRTGIFELLVVTDQMREILMKQPKLELLKKAARASRQRSLQEEGVLLVAKGETSLPELMRVLKT